jgi:hypothetical protein
MKKECRHARHRNKEQWTDSFLGLAKGENPPRATEQKLKKNAGTISQQNRLYSVSFFFIINLYPGSRHQELDIAKLLTLLVANTFEKKRTKSK